MAGDNFWELKTGKASAIRCDLCLSATARVIGLELLTWVKSPGDRPIFGDATNNRKLRERLGFSDYALRCGKKELKDREHFRFQRSGRADLAWVIGLGADQRSLDFSDQIAGASQGRSLDFSDQIAETAQGRSLDSSDPKSRKSQTSKIAGISPQEVSNGGHMEEVEGRPIGRSKIARGWREAKDEGRNALADFAESLAAKRANRAR